MQIIDLVPDLRPVILAAREMRDARNSLATFLPYAERQTVSYRLGRRQRADQTVPIRAIDAPSIPIRLPGVNVVKGDLPAITPRVDLSEQDLTNEMMVAQQLNGQTVDWMPAVINAAGQAALTVDNTFEALRGQALSTMGIALTSEDGLTHEVNFGATAEQTTTVTTPWTAGGNALADFRAAAAKHLDIAGMSAGVVLTTSRVKGALLAALGAAYPQQPVDLNTLNAYLTANDLPQIMTYDRTFTAYDGTKQRVYPEGHMTFLPSATDTIGNTELGITQEAVQQTQRLQLNGAAALMPSEAPGVTIVTLGKDDPVQRAVKAAAIGMPVIRDIDQITVVKGIF
ncbi:MULTISPECIES: major capsid protein [unclassified Luteococcus]|uniref:major capsid protein n=1 Tax=unclassified Luteococcus TaxID=2639923 RepID=UPI00313A907F